MDRLEPVAERIGAAGELERARALIERNGAIRQREVAARRGRARARAVARGPVRPRHLIYGREGRVTALGWPACPNRADPLSEVLLGALRGAPGTAGPRHPPSTGSTRWRTRTCSSRSTAATSCTTAASPAWTTAGSGTRGCWSSAPASRRPSRRPCWTSWARPPAQRLRRRWIWRSGRSPRATKAPRCPATSSARPTWPRWREFLIHRSAYQLKEADPHSWALPRLSGPPKAALVEIQADEYGGGRPERIHATMFARSMEALQLDSTPGAYLDAIPGYTLATVNLMSLLGPPPALARRDRRPPRAVRDDLVDTRTGATPTGLRRLGLGEQATAFFDEHVEADAVHENIAAVDLAGGLVRQQPDLGPRRALGCARAGRARRALGRRRSARLGGGRVLAASRRSAAHRRET